MRKFGRKIYDLIQDVKNTKIFTGHIFLKISNVVIDLEKHQVLAFYVKYEIIDQNWIKMTKLRKLIEMMRVLAKLFSMGYRFCESDFNLKECNDIVTVLSFLNKESDEVSRKFSKGCIIKLIHYYLSGGIDFDEFYSDISKREFLRVKLIQKDIQILDIGEIGQYYEIFKMSYKYYTEGIVPDLVEETILKQIDTFRNIRIYESLNINRKSYIDCYELIINPDANQDEICYCSISGEYKYFIENNGKLIYLLAGVQIKAFLFSIDGEFIGYRFNKTEESEDLEYKSLLELNFCCQRDIVDFLFKLSMKMGDLFYNSKKNWNVSDKTKNVMEIFKVSEDLNEIKFNSVEDLFMFSTISEKEYKEALNEIFVKMYLKFLEDKYGKFNTKSEFFEKIEIRYLQSKIANKIINYALYNREDFKGSFELFLNKKLYDDKYKIYYDSRLESRPSDVKLIFWYELKELVSKPKRGEKYILEDGRKVVIFDKRKEFLKFKDVINWNITNLEEKLNLGENYKIKICKASEIIISRTMDNNGMYYVLGYITQPIGDKELTDNVLMSLSNKDFINVVANLYSNFDDYYIDEKNISLDKDMNYYIDVCHSKIDIIKQKKRKKYIVTVLKRLIQNGFNLRRFKNIDLKQDKDILLDTISNFKLYCTKHNYYYSENSECPICKDTIYIVEKKMLENYEQIYKDDIATHYKVEGNECLKIYNKDCTFLDIAKIEDNVDSIITHNYMKKEPILGQNMFLPIKKAIMVNETSGISEFIGYSYVLDEDSTKLDDRKDCIRLENYEKLRNIGRVKGCLRLIIQYQELTKQNRGFKNPKFGSVVISKKYPKQVQLINPEFITEIEDINESNRYLIEYIYDILKDEDIIRKEFIISMTIGEVQCTLESYLKEMSKYCPYHNLYYSQRRIFCPKCMSDEDIRKLDVLRLNKSEIKKWKPVNEGGESYIYEYQTNGAVTKNIMKIFKDEEISNEFKTNVISKILNKRDTILQLNKTNSKFQYIVPKKLIVDVKTNNIIGYTMKKVKGNPLFMLRDKNEVEKLNLSLKDRMEILINVGEGIKNLHEKCNIFIGDLNGRNILFDNNKKVYFLDFDGMGIEDISPEFYTEGYVDPISQNNKCITMKDDWYSFAIQAFYYLTYTHPFNGVYMKNKTELDIIEKMEQRISLLGRHGMTVPTIAEDWSWMTKELQDTFLNIFEGDYRGDIIELLKNQNINIMPIKGKVESPIGENTINVSVEEINPFGEDMYSIITEKVCIIGKNTDKALLILLKDTKKIINLEDYLLIKDIIISDDEKLAFVIFEENLEVYDIEFNTKLYAKRIKNDTNVRVNDRVLYYNINKDQNNIIYKIIFNEDNSIEKISIKFKEEFPTKAFNVLNNEKFVIIKSGADKELVFCNDQKIGSINNDEMAFNYNILYDKYTKKWLIIGDNGDFSIIFPNGSFKDVSRPQIDKCNVEKIIYSKGKIYVPLDGKLYIFNAETKEEKTLILDKHVDKHSKILIEKDGFTAITDYKMYKYILN